MGQLKIIDTSDDKKYFTIIPNMIVNGSTHWEQSLYLVMKRIAGEGGECYASIRTLAEKMGCSVGQVSNTIKKLLKRGWIELVGTKKGRTAPVNCYKIIDLWHENVQKYAKKDRSQSEQSQTVQETGKTVHQMNGHRSPDELKNKHIKNKHIKNIEAHKKFSSLKDIQEADLIEISQKYRVSLGFVKLQFEKLKNYCEAKGRVYKNYKSALRNFVLGDMQRQIERRQDDPKRGIDARNIT